MLGELREQMGTVRQSRDARATQLALETLSLSGERGPEKQGCVRGTGDSQESGYWHLPPPTAGPQPTLTWRQPLKTDTAVTENGKMSMTKSH